VGGLSRAHLEKANRNQLQQTLEELLAALKNKSQSEIQTGERHGNGSLKITSHIAVWLIGKITEAYGSRLVRLSKVSSPESLRSTRGLADLLKSAITKDLGQAHHE
jgi:hypothetical protein